MASAQTRCAMCTVMPAMSSPRQLDFADVYANSYVDAEAAAVVFDRKCTSDGLRSAVEGCDGAVTGIGDEVSIEPADLFPYLKLVAIECLRRAVVANLDQVSVEFTMSVNRTVVSLRVGTSST